MKDVNLAKICLLLAIVGIGVLFFITEMIKPVSVKISEIDSSLVGSSVLVNANIKSVSTKDGNVFMDLHDGATIKAVMFSRDAQKNADVYNLQKNDNITAVGEISIYQGGLEIVLQTVKKI